MRNLLVLGLVSVGLLAGCGSSTSTSDYKPPADTKLSETDEMKIPESGTVFAMDEEKFYELVYSAYQEVLPEAKVSVLTFPVRGYTTKWLAPPYYLDWQYISAKMVRVSGVDAAGDKQTGYLVEVTSRGTSFLQGNLKKKRLFEVIYSRLNQYAEAKDLTGIKQVDFKLSREKMYVSGSDSLQ